LNNFIQKTTKMPTFQTQYTSSLRCQNTHLQSGTVITTDAPTDNMGMGQAFSPTDLVATALGTCIITTMAIFGQKEGITFDGSHLQGTKIMTSDGPRKIAEIQLEIVLKTQPTLTAQQKEKYERIAETCPVARSLHPDLLQKNTLIWDN
jgi:putative redox protein